MSHNIHLYNDFRDGNLAKFTEELEVFEADLNFYVESKGLTVLEHILSTPESASFIKECIENGADFCIKNKNGKYPLHFVIESKSLENLKAVEHLLVPTTANVKKRNTQNSLHMLVEYLENDNFDSIFQMIKILLTHGCNANVANSDGKTPFLMLLEKEHQIDRGQEVVEYFIQNGDIDLNVIVDRKILNLYVDNEKLSSIDVDLPTFESMLNFLENDEINKFETRLTSFKALCASDEAFREHCTVFLEIAVRKSMINIVDLLISSGVDVNKISNSSMTKYPPIFDAYKIANPGIFTSFLQCPDVKLYTETISSKRTLLHYFFDEFKAKTTKFKNYVFTRKLTHNERKCFDLLLADPRCDRDYLNVKDEGKYPAIKYAVQYKIDYIAIELLRKGAYIGTVVNKIRKSLLNELLDKCITTNDCEFDDPDLTIQIDYRFLMPPVPNPLHRSTSHVHISIASLDPIITHNEDVNQPKYSEEMKPLLKIAENVEMERLITHPVLSSFIFLKWSKVSFLVYINLCLTLFYMLTFIPFIIIHRIPIPQERHPSTHLLYFFYILSIISLSMLIIREALQFLLSYKQYLVSYTNLIDIILIFSSVIILIHGTDRSFGTSYLPYLHTFVILITVAEYFKLLGFVPILSVSLYTKMFKKVSITFLKSLAFYSVLILGFAFGFYTMQGEYYANTLKTSTAVYPDDNFPRNLTRTDRYNNFYSVGLSIVKTFIMLTGEMEASYIHLEGFGYSALFLIFIFLVTIVLFNLLNALAVSDTQEIKSDAKLIDLHQRIMTMHKCEDGVFKTQSRLKMMEIISLFPDALPTGVVCLKPNKSGRSIFVRKRKLISNESLPNFLSAFKSYMKMNEDIVHDMRLHILGKKEEKAADIMRKLKENHYEKMAKDIAKLNNMMIDIKKKLNALS